MSPVDIRKTALLVLQASSISSLGAGGTVTGMLVEVLLAALGLRVVDSGDWLGVRLPEDLVGLNVEFSYVYVSFVTNNT